MKTIQAEVSDEIAAQAAQAAARRNQSLAEFVAAALERQISIIDKHESYETRAARGNAAAFRSVLDRIPNAPPVPGDEI